MKKGFIALFMSFILIFSISCFGKDGIKIENKIEKMTVNYTYTFSEYINDEKVFYVSGDSDIISIDSYTAKANDVGYCQIYVYNFETGVLVRKDYIEVVGINPEKIIASVEKNILEIGETLQIDVTVEPANADNSCSFKSSDPSVVTVNKNGIIEAKSSGVATITICSLLDQNIKKEIVIIVEPEDIIINKDEKEEFIREEVNISNMKQLFSPIIEKATESIIGVRSYVASKVVAQATGLIYKEDVLDSYYKYYVLVNKKTVYETDKVELYYGDYKYIATVIACDTKENLAVLSFESKEKYSPATIGDSDNVRTGQFIISIGNAFEDGEHSASFGIISSKERYVSVDTDNDSVNDWDALYLQHDASLSNGMMGSAVVDLNGNVIALNTTTITSAAIENLGFAIPINNCMALASQLEKGIVPERPLLGINGLYINDIKTSEYLMDLYNIPEDLTYGIYVDTVSIPSVAYSAGIQSGDIILEFDGVLVKYSYVLRAKLGEFTIGSNDSAEMIVYRDGELVTLKVVF